MARTSAAGRRTCFLIIVLLLLAAVLMGYQYLFPAPKGQTAHIFVDGKEAASFPLNKDLGPAGKKTAFHRYHHM